MHWNFYTANGAFGTACGEDYAFNDSTWNVVYVDSHDYSPNDCQSVRYTGGEQAWAENMDLMFTFRGIPCVYYGSEIEFQKGMPIDKGTTAPLASTGRAYFGDNIEGSVTATDFGKYSGASGSVATTLNKPLAKHLQQLNQIRRAVPALQKGQYTTSNVSNSNIAFTRRYTAGGVDSLACVAISGGATFNNLPNGKYIDAVTGDVKNVTNGTLAVSSVGKANMRVYVCCASGFKGISGKIGTNGTYLK
jgi:glycosidase